MENKFTDELSDDFATLLDEPNQRTQRIKDVLLIVLLAVMVFTTTMFLLG